MKAFTDGIVSWNKRRYGVDINPEMLVITTGVHPGLIAALRTFSPPGSKVLLLTPTYNGFYGDLTATGTIAEESPLKLVNGRYSIDFEDFERRISHDTNSLILCNPQNPTGNCWSKEDMLRLGEICTRRRVVVLADEILRLRLGQQVRLRSIGNKEIVQPHVQGRQQVVRPCGDECAWFYRTTRLPRPRQGEPADLTTLKDDREQGRVGGEGGQRVRRLHRW